MTAVDDYIAALDRAHRRGDATEHSYRPALKTLLESRASNVEATNEPQRIARNAPDFVVRRNATILGHVEAKDIGEPLDKLLKSDQLKRYAEALPNLIFTDYLDFIWLEYGEPKLRVRLGVITPRGLPDGVTAEDIFHFIYGVLHAPAYRSRYAEYLRSDFPRIPLPADLPTFRALAVLGERLVEVHLLRDASLDEGAPAFPVSGSGTVERLRYEAPQKGTPGRVWINATQYFEGIEPETWSFRVGGYQVLEKWLKDRKGRALGIDDIVHYRRVAVALARTRALMQDVDKAAAPLFAPGPELTEEPA